jgi:hypothetical protein
MMGFFVCSEQGPSDGFYEHGTKSLVQLKVGDFLTNREPINFSRILFQGVCLLIS